MTRSRRRAETALLFFSGRCRRLAGGRGELHSHAPAVGIPSRVTALAIRNLNRRTAALGRRLFRLIHSRRLPSALPTGETLLELTVPNAAVQRLCLHFVRDSLSTGVLQGTRIRNTPARMIWMSDHRSGGAFLRGKVAIYPAK